MAWPHLVDMLLASSEDGDCYHVNTCQWTMCYYHTLGMHKIYHLENDIFKYYILYFDLNVNMFSKESKEW